MSHAFWRSRLGSDESAIGSPLTLQDQLFTIVGVTPPSFTGLEVGQASMSHCRCAPLPILTRGSTAGDRWWLTIMGRLGQDWTIARADQQLRALSGALLDATIPPGYDAGLVAGYRAIRFGVFLPLAVSAACARRTAPRWRCSWALPRWRS